MPEINILNPTVLNGLIEKFTPPEDASIALTQIFSHKEPSQDAVAEWDVIEGNREIAAPNVPNSEAHIVPQLGVGKRTASFVYLREKKVFKPTTIRWLRTPGQLAAKNATKAVTREVRDLDRRFDAFAEYCCWQALTGTLTINTAQVQATVDYGIDATHKPTVAPGEGWDVATVEQWIDQVKAWKRTMSLDAGTRATDVWLNGNTWDRVGRILSGSPELLSDRRKDQLLNTGEVPDLLGLTWHVIDTGYVDSAGDEQFYVADDALVMTSGANNAFYLMEGPSADEDAPDGHVGKFVKSWKEPDPSARQHLEEWSFIPVIERPEQIVYVGDVTPA